MGGDFGVLNMAWSAHALWFMGLSDQALQRGHKALAMADRVGHPFSQALALAYLAMQHVFRREFDLTLNYARQAYDFAERHNVGYYYAWSDVLLCWASAKQSPNADAVARMQRAIESFRVTGGRIRLTLYLGLLAECLGDVGETEAAFAALAEALDCSERFGEHWVDAELYRLRGDLLLRNSANIVEAESWLMKALEIARAQGARPFELRAALSLAKLRQAQHDAEERAAVESAFAQLTEGFDQPDVVEAQALLAR
jgi:predicted ATPase